MHKRLSEQIATLSSLNKTQLLAIWAENFSKDPPPNLRKGLIVPIPKRGLSSRSIPWMPNERRVKRTSSATS
jgi:hypothetical protein